MHIALYVDDLLVSLHDDQDSEDFVSYMSDVTEMKIKDLGDMSEFCGMEFIKVDAGYYLHQQKYIDDLLKRFDQFIRSHRQKVSINSYEQYSESPLLDEKGIKLYQELFVCFNLLAVNSRPDLGYCQVRDISDARECMIVRCIEAD